MRVRTSMGALALFLGLATECDAEQDGAVHHRELFSSTSSGSGSGFEPSISPGSSSLFPSYYWWSPTYYYWSPTYFWYSDDSVASPPTPAPTPAEASRRGYCSGDPHCRSFDGLYFDCQGQGDFLLVNAESTETVVQARFETVWSYRPTITGATGVAAREGNSTLLEVTVIEGNIELLVDGAPYDGTSPLAGVSLVSQSNYFEMVFPSGIVVRAAVYSEYMNIEVSVPTDVETAGLLGNNNGDISDDWETSEGDPITLPGPYPSIVQGTIFCSENWAILGEGRRDLRSDSRRLATIPTLFDSASPELIPGPGETYIAPTIPEDLDQEIIDLCGDNEACIFDAALIDLEVATATLEVAEEPELPGLCEPNSFSVDGTTPCTGCPEGEISGWGATACVDLPTAPPTPAPTPAPSTSPTASPTLHLTPSPTSNPTPSPTSHPTPSPIEPFVPVHPCLDSTSIEYRCIPDQDGRRINLSECGLTDAEGSMLRSCFEASSSLTALKRIILSNNDFETLPGNLFDGMTSLKKLVIKSNDLKTLPSDFLAGLQVLEKLNLKGNCNLDCLPTVDGGAMVPSIITSGCMSEDTLPECCVFR